MLVQSPIELKRTKGDIKDNASLSSTGLLESVSCFQKIRRKWDPCLPNILRSPVKAVEVDNFGNELNKVKYNHFSSFFPMTIGSKFVELRAISESTWQHYPARRVGVVLSGGQAAGGHNVIAGIMSYIKVCNPSSQLFGFLGGPEGVYTERYIELKEELIMSQFRNQGGFNIICSGRHKIETEEQMQASLNVCEKLQLNGLIIIGGDDSNTNAAILAEYFKKEGSNIVVIGCPKTIDGDLKNEVIETSFGYDTATKVYCEEIGSIMTSLLTKRDRYHFVRLMGRSASHITLECALQTHPNLTFIGEEIKEKNRSLMSIIDEIVEMILLRESMDKKFGIVLLPEGLIEFIPEFEVLIKEFNSALLIDTNKEQIISRLSNEARNLFQELPPEVQNQLLLERDPHGNVQVAKIATEDLLVHLTITKLKEIGKEYLLNNAKTHYLGYEGRCALPSNFDSNYCYALGHAAGALIDNRCTGYMAIIRNLHEHPKLWIPAGCPLINMMNIEVRKGKSVPVIKKYLVELDGVLFNLFSKVREHWKVIDYYRNPGPIQFDGPLADISNYMICHPKIEDLLPIPNKDGNQITSIGCVSPLQMYRCKEILLTPSLLSSKTICTEEEYFSSDTDVTSLLLSKLPFQLNKTNNKTLVFCEDNDLIRNNGNLLTNQISQFSNSLNIINNSQSTSTPQSIINSLNFTNTNVGSNVCDFGSGYSIPPSPSSNSPYCIGFLLIGLCQPPGTQNVINGILDNFINLNKIVIFNSIDSLYSGKGYVVNLDESTREIYSYLLNNGGCQFPCSKYEPVALNLQYNEGSDNIEEKDDEKFNRSVWAPFENILMDDIWKVFDYYNMSGLVVLGDSDAITIASYLTENLCRINYNKTCIVTIPTSLENNVKNPMIDTCIGFDTVTHNCSTLVGNLLIDAASATKYWYFMKLIGSKTSNLVLETSLQTHPNIVVIPERYSSSECKYVESGIMEVTLDDIITEICDIICLRNNIGDSFGGIIISEGILDQVYPTKEYRRLIFEKLAVDQYDNNEEGNYKVKTNLTANQDSIKNISKLSNLTSNEISVIEDFKSIFKKVEEKLIRKIETCPLIEDVPTELIIAQLVNEELIYRKTQGIYKGNFSYVCFNFGYQVSSTVPTELDCNLGYLNGKLAGKIIEKNLIGGYMTGIKGICSKIEDWYFYAIPLTSLLHLNMKDNIEKMMMMIVNKRNSNSSNVKQVNKGGNIYNNSLMTKVHLSCRNNQIDMICSKPYKLFLNAIEKWELNNVYINPGPVQYYGSSKYIINRTLFEEEFYYVKMLQELDDLTRSIKNSCSFGINNTILETTICLLRSVQSFINIQSTHSKRKRINDTSSQSNLMTKTTSSSCPISYNGTSLITDLPNIDCTKSSIIN
ncbi:phosphofructokinase family protein [Cryptosporidium andersoni]|uniref:Pyrophosphate--fructose 6-phosphate 1-phosphotransferase n=1 Tax=Cryptosporidium andersoni TaxID=117008 RepID=A0A1J4MDU2_9CRYT|nr:phosphofructokinase family protein [Cryptosporidium andersoni]